MNREKQEYSPRQSLESAAKVLIPTVALMLLAESAFVRKQENSAPLTVDKARQIRNEVERMFAMAACRARDFLVFHESVYVTTNDNGSLERTDPNKKVTTLPDFRIVRRRDKRQIFVEVTAGALRNKKEQREVMREAGLARNYVRLTETQICHLINRYGTNMNNMLQYLFDHGR